MASWKRVDKTLQHRLSEMAKFGQSKHQAKQVARENYIKTHGNLSGYNPSKVDGIYSIGTMETYRSAARDFSKWAVKNGINNANKITRDDAARYLQEREKLSAWTVSRDMSAINKIFGYELNKKELGLEQRHQYDVTRSRGECEHDKYAHQERYADQIAFARACGCRRQSIEQVRYQDLVWNNGRVVAVELVEKGGKERVAPILNEYKDKITEIANNLKENHDDFSSTPLEKEYLFTEYDSHIDNHSFRAEYAAALFCQLEQERAEGLPLCQGDFAVEGLCNLRGRDISDDPSYRGHDRDICGMVSGALGHNRLEVVFSSYNYKM